MTGDSVELFVPGVPVQQGSKTLAHGGGKTWMRDANAKRLKPWRAEVAKAADVGVTFDCPVEVRLRFLMPRPKRPRFSRPAVKPDIDKLTRSILDGLTSGGLISDDARVVKLVAEEYYDEYPGVHVTVREMEES